MAKGLVDNGTLSAPANYGGTNAPIEVAYAEPSSVSTSSNAKSASTASDDATSTLHTSVALLLIAVVALWLFGGVVFRDVNL